MTLEAKVWKIESGRVEQLERSRLDEEARLEDWLCTDISLLNDELLIIGRQVGVDGGAIDLLAIDEEGNLVIIELKRDRTARDVVAQTLDYASSVQEFNRGDVERHTQDFLNKELDQAFREKFEHEPPESVNERHRIYVVASSLDSATARIIEYLSKVHSVDINAATFSYFHTEQGEFIVRSLLLDEQEVEKRAEARPTKRQVSVPEEILREMAVKNGAGDLWDIAIDGFGRIAKRKRSKSTLYFQRPLDGGLRAVMTVFPGSSSGENGLAVTVVVNHMARAFDVDEDQIRQVCGAHVKTPFHGSYSATHDNYYLSNERLEALLNLVDDNHAQ